MKYEELSAHDRDNLPMIVFSAYFRTVTDIGQLTTKEKYQLNKWTKKGLLFKTENWRYPVPKTMWVANQEEQNE